MNGGAHDGSGKPPPENRRTLNTASIAVSGNRIDSGALFASSREILILHGDETYRLRLTAQNKLILTK